MLAGKRILLLIGGGLAACRAPELIAALRAEGALVTPELTPGGARYVTPLAIGAADDGESPADLILAAPADDALRTRLRADAPATPVLIAADPAPAAVVEAARAALAHGPLSGRHILVTSGPTHEPIDPVRYIANRSSGQQGTALAAALRDLGARVSFVTGPASTPAPAGVTVIRVETARQMLEAVEAALPADAAVFAAAVADWRVANEAGQKMKKQAGTLPTLTFAENPDILATVSRHALRPALVVGFAAETEQVVAHAQAKRARKGCDWIVANDVSPATGIMGGAENAVHLITATTVEDWPRLAKGEVARRLAARIAESLT